MSCNLMDSIIRAYVLTGTGAVAQVYKLISVTKVTDLTELPFLARELMLVKVRTRQPATPRRYYHSITESSAG